MVKLYAFALLLILFSCSGDHTGNNDNNVTNTNLGLAAPAAIRASVIAEYPHDTTAFTEGLQFYNGKLYESTGLEKRSMIKVVDLKTGNAEKKHPIADTTIFGEGINVFKGKLFQLTYQNHLVYVYDLSDLGKPVKTFPWQTEGWGMTNNGTELIISDGQTEGNLYFVNPDDFRINRIVQVTDNVGVINNINELEYIDGYIYANIYGETYILKIDPANGHVAGKLETEELLRSFYASFPIKNNLNNVLNGIAYDTAAKKMYITGKLWPKLFELRLNN